MQFVAYSDIHHDDYQNGITLDDVVAVEDRITEYAVQHGIKHVFFNGDWYRATNPLQMVIKAAEAAWKRRSDAGIITFALVGNHDRFTKSAISGHAFMSAQIFNRDLANIVVVDKVELRHVDGVDFLFIPSGHETNNLPIRAPGRHCPFIVLFHGLVEGSSLANGGSVSGGIQPRDLAALKGDLALGGDNHTAQPLDALLGYPSMYLGATMQHNWGDAGQSRGWWHFNIDNGSSGWVINRVFVGSQAPRFLTLTIKAIDEMAVLCDIAGAIGKDQSPTILDVRLVGENAPHLNRQYIEKSLLQCGVRKIRLWIDHGSYQADVSQLINAKSQPEDRWAAYLATKESKELDGLDPKKLHELGKWSIEQAKQAI